MAIVRTERNIVLWQPEVTYGVNPSSSANLRFGIHETINVPDPTFDWQPKWDIFSQSSRSRRTVIRGRWSLRGSVPEILVQPIQSTDQLFAMALGHTTGTLITEGLVAGVDERIPSFMVQVAYRDTAGVTDLIKTYLGCKINRCTWQAREGEELRFSVDEFIAQNVFQGGMFSGAGANANYNNLLGVGIETADPGPSPQGRFIFSGATVTLTGGGLSGLVLARLRRIALSLDNQLTPKYYVNASANNPTFVQVLGDLVEGKRTYTSDLEIDFGDPSTDFALWQFLINQAGAGAGPSTGCTITATFKTEAAHPGNHTMTINIDSLSTSTFVGSVLKSGAMNLPGPPAGLIPVSLAFDSRSVNITHDSWPAQ